MSFVSTRRLFSAQHNLNFPRRDLGLILCHAVKCDRMQCKFSQDTVCRSPRLNLFTSVHTIDCPLLFVSPLDQVDASHIQRSENASVLLTLSRVALKQKDFAEIPS